MEYIKTPTGQLNPDIRYTDDLTLEKLLKRDIGKWGYLWQQWIETTTLNKVLYEFGCTWWIIPRIVDIKAYDRLEELNAIYERDNERPTNFNDVLAWETERKIWAEHIIMEEIVQVEYPTHQEEYYGLDLNIDDENK